MVARLCCRGGGDARGGGAVGHGGTGQQPPVDLHRTKPRTVRRANRRLWALVALAIVMAGTLSSVARVASSVSHRIAHHARHVGAFTDVTRSAGIRAVHARGPTREWAVPITGQAWGDVDRD